MADAVAFLDSPLPTSYQLYTASEGRGQESGVPIGKDATDWTLSCTDSTSTTLSGGANYDLASLAVDDGSGYVWVARGQSYARGSTVLDACYRSLFGVRVTNPDRNAWRGAITYSKTGVYRPLMCATGCRISNGRVSTSSIAVDGNDDATGSPRCINGKICSLGGFENDNCDLDCSDQEPPGSWAHNTCAKQLANTRGKLVQQFHN